MLIKKRYRTISLGLSTLLIMGCDGSGGDSEDDPTANFEELDVSICSPSSGPFTLDIDNQYFPLPVGLALILEGKDDGETVRVEITVLNEVEEVAGVTTRVVEEAEYEDDELVEVSRNFFVQAQDGTVCYYGEDVDDYAAGEIVGHAGEWRAGVDDNEPGIIMPGNPMVETKFDQESAPGIAQDRSAIVGIGGSRTVPAGEFVDVLHAIDWNPLEGETASDAEDKYYAPGLGLIVDDVVVLISYSD